ncbi:MAG TPA: hypothetical protein PKE63_12765, partial [Lacibacter sp.]|nr:hypothetical protein [Lacibacter sp.]
PPKQAELVSGKLLTMAADTQVPANKKGIALFASPVYEKLLFLDAMVPARVVIDESFEIRDLVFSRKEQQQFILFLLSSEHCKLFMGENGQLMPVKLQSPDSLEAYWNDSVERVSNFTDPDEYKTTQVEKFMRQMDKELQQVMNSHRLPVFIMGTKTILGLFKSITRNSSVISGYAEGNFDNASVPQLLQVLEPAFAAWKRRQHNQLLEQIEQAANEKKLATGIQDVWEQAYQKKGRLLIVEKNFTAAGEHISDGKIVYKPTGKENDFHLSNDVVDDAIELVLRYGGDVAFVEDGSLQQFDHIALIQFYV